MEKTTKKGYNKIELLCDVYFGENILKKGEIIEIKQEDISKFAESFFKFIL